MTINNLRTMLQQMGPHIPELDAILEESPGSWQLFFEDEQLVNIHFSDEESGIELVADLGTPESDHELEVLRTLLCYQLLWRGSNQPRIALNAPSGSLVCLSQISPGLIDTAKLERAILEFWLQTKTLIELVSAGAPLQGSSASLECMHLHA